MIFYLFIILISFPLLALSPEVESLLKEEDTDGDYKITILDKGDRVFVYKGTTIRGHYHLSNLLQELTLAKEKVDLKKITENPVDRLSRMIREYYWDGLTRSLSENNLAQVLPDSKVDTSGVNYLYVPENDSASIKKFTDIAARRKDLKLKVEELSTSHDVKSIYEGRHGLLALAPDAPYVVPGGRFNEMYGWDSYFESVGLKLDGREDLIKSMIKNFTYEINHYGKILNANRTYYLFRSQPPFFTSMTRLLLKGQDKPEWLDEALAAAMKEYETVWMGPERLTSIGLSRYGGKSMGIPPEVEPGHFHEVLEPFARKHQLKVSDYVKKYQKGQIKEKELDQFFEHDVCVRESGHDTTYRFRYKDKDACKDFVTVDLNVLLYKTEMDLFYLVQTFYKGSFNGKLASYYKAQAEKRKELIQKYLWDEKTGFFYDYHLPSGKRSTYISATGFYPLWVDEGKLLTDAQAKRVLSFGLSKLEGPGGIYASAKESRLTGDKAERQWDWPYGWAPHQMIIWKGLLNYGFREDADRLISKWLRMIAENARDYNGTVPEKFDVQKRSHAVFAEYGNVGTEFSYITKEGFGWMNASFQYGLHLLPQKSLQTLRNKL